MGLAAVVLVAAGCGEAPNEGSPDPAQEPPVEEPSSAESGGRLVDSQAALPQELAEEFADIATTSADAAEVWQRFQLTGDPPQIDFDTTALVAVGFGESGSCPARFDGLNVDGNRVGVEIGIEGGPACTDDYNPRTMVLEVEREVLPDDGFELTVTDRTFVLSSVPLSEPPPHHDAVVSRLTAEDPQLDVDAQPRSVAAGEPVELVLVNEGDVSASTGSWPMALHRWDEQRWLPADSDQDVTQSSSNIVDQTVTVEPGDQQVAALIDTDELDPGWYGVSIKLQLGGRGGAAEVHGSFEVAAP